MPSSQQDSGPNPHSSPTPLVSSQASTNPNARRYLVNILGQGPTLVALQEAREYFALGYDIRDPTTGAHALVGAVPIPSFADDQGSFADQEEGVDAAKEAVSKNIGSKDEHPKGNGVNGHLNGGPKDGENGDGGAGAGAGIAA